MLFKHSAFKVNSKESTFGPGSKRHTVSWAERGTRAEGTGWQADSVAAHTQRGVSTWGTVAAHVDSVMDEAFTSCSYLCSQCYIF